MLFGCLGIICVVAAFVWAVLGFVWVVFHGCCVFVVVIISIPHLLWVTVLLFVTVGEGLLLLLSGFWSLSGLVVVCYCVSLQIYYLVDLVWFYLLACYLGLGLLAGFGLLSGFIVVCFVFVLFYVFGVCVGLFVFLFVDGVLFWALLGFGRYLVVFWGLSF